MRPFHELSRAGRLRRLHNVAADILKSYDLDDPTLTYHGFETNLLYRVTTKFGRRYMFRCASPGWRSYENLVSEAMWLEALDRDTDIPVPVIVRSRTGELVLSVTDDRINGTWNTSLMHWVPGRVLGHFLTPENLRLMGILFAKLHRHGATWTPPNGFSNHRFESWLSRGELNLVAELPRSIPKRARDSVDRMDRVVSEAYHSIDRKDLRVIHCDLWHGNIRIHRGVLHPLDFEDTIWGYRSHDIAMAMLDLLENTDEERYPGLLSAFRTGYEELMEWPRERIEPLQIGRLLWKINWVARHEAEWLGEMIDRHLPVFERFEKSGAVTLPAPPVAP